jgi:hypothetical protein
VLVDVSRNHAVISDTGTSRDSAWLVLEARVDVAVVNKPLRGHSWHSMPEGSAGEIPLPEIGRKDVVHIDVNTANERTRAGSGVHRSLIKHR